MTSRFVPALALLGFSAAALDAQPRTGSIEGKVTVGAGKPIHNADVVLVRQGLRTESAEDGSFQFTGLTPGRYHIIAHMHGMTDTSRAVDVRAGETATVEFVLSVSPIREQVTVTATGRSETPLETFLSSTSVSQIDLAAKSGSTSLGDLLDDQAGIHKRSFGPGTTRPVVRGFDGDRVLVLQDGVRTGTLSSQSGDHGEPVDSAVIERLEVVRGPATLLYGSNAVGGVINAISPEHEMAEKPHAGLSGNLSATGGSANGQGGGSGNLRYGLGNWQMWGGGGSMRTGDYATPIGTIHNSGTEMKNLRFGLGHYSAGKAVSLGYDMQDGRYGVPAGPEQGDGHGYGHEEDVELAFRRHQFRFNGSLRNLGPSFEQFNLKLNYSDWNHRELEGGKIGTEFYNKQFIYRGELQQRRCGRLSGSLGFWGLARDFRTEGEETLTPPVTHNAFALFALEQIDLERLRLQFGGRFERNSYDPDGVRKRSFNGLSASAGANFALWSGGAVVSNFTHSYRAPALEELYNNGPHPGNSAFEIGNASLRSEISNGLDFALRHQGRRFRGEANLFAYGIKRFVYGAPTGQIEDGLPELEYEQGDARFTGVEMRTSAQVHSKLWLNLGVDAVRARLPLANQPLPRIPPARGRVGLDFLHKGLSVRPELVLTRQQNAIFLTETRTPGYVLPNLVASYSLARRHALHVVTVNVFNVGNVLYRNHLSLIKAFAPEIGRGVRVSYNVHFF